MIGNIHIRTNNEFCKTGTLHGHNMKKHLIKKKKPLKVYEEKVSDEKLKEMRGAAMDMLKGK